MSHVDEMLPIRVHITGTDVVAPAAAAKRQKRLTLSPHTITLTAQNPFMSLCGQEPNRTLVKVLVTDNPVVLCDSAGQAGQLPNTVAGLTNPEGAYLPVSTIFYDFPTNDQLWVAAAVFPTRVTVVLVSEADM